LPEENYRWCGSVCATAARRDRERRRDQEEEYLRRRASEWAWSKRQPERTCPVCGRAFRPKQQGQKLCSKACNTHALRELGRSARRSVPGVCESV
jgi:predicted nucleic acid-binding Zn ribbon protein